MGRSLVSAESGIGIVAAMLALFCLAAVTATVTQIILNMRKNQQIAERIAEQRAIVAGVRVALSTQSKNQVMKAPGLTQGPQLPTSGAPFQCSPALANSASVASAAKISLGALVVADRAYVVGDLPTSGTGNIKLDQAFLTQLQVATPPTCPSTCDASNLCDFELHLGFRPNQAPAGSSTTSSLGFIRWSMIPLRCALSGTSPQEVTNCVLR